ncbi:MAG: hypothetical protein U1A77_21580 [Pirellulales bacterium]
MSANVFKFNGHEFPVAHARLSASLADPVWCDQCNKGAGKALSWSLELEADEREVNGDLIAPSIDINDLPITPKSWPELAGQSAEWHTPLRPETGDRYGMTYVWDHKLIREAKVSIGRRDGLCFQVSVEGASEEGEEFRVQAEAPFTGVQVHFSGADTAESVIARLALVLDTSSLQPGPFKTNRAKYNAGYRQFTPKAET